MRRSSPQEAETSASLHQDVRWTVSIGTCGGRSPSGRAVDGPRRDVCWTVTIRTSAGRGWMSVDIGCNSVFGGTYDEGFLQYVCGDLRKKQPTRQAGRGPWCLGRRSARWRADLCQTLCKRGTYDGRRSRIASAKFPMRDRGTYF